MASSSKMPPPLRAFAKDIRARLHGINDALGTFAAAVAASGSASIRAGLRGGAARLRYEWGILTQIPSILRSNHHHHHRGVAIAPRVLLLGLLFLQLLVFLAFRSGSTPPVPPSLESPLEQSQTSLRSLYSVKPGNFQPPGAAAGRNPGKKSQKQENRAELPPRKAEAAKSVRDLRNVGKKQVLPIREAESVGDLRNVGKKQVLPIPEAESVQQRKDSGRKSLPDRLQDVEFREDHEERDESAEENADAQEEHEEQDDSSHAIGDSQEEQTDSDEEHVESTNDSREEHQEPDDSVEEHEEQGVYSREEHQDRLAAMATSILEEDPVCKGGRIFVYDLPKAFNADLVANCSTLNPWVSLCDALSNDGLGKPMPPPAWHTAASTARGGPSTAQSPWYYTEQFSGELIYHARIRSHPCVTNDSTMANVFYVPFYAGLDVSRYLWKPSEAKDRDFLARTLVKWLLKSPNWRRCGGCDHFTMIGRITWDFRREEEKAWGSNLLHMDAMRNMTKLVIESNPWEGGEFGVPYPTSFHPKSQSDIRDWQNYLKSKDRDILFAFAGATRRRIPNDFRLLLLDECTKSSKCSALDCSEGKCETPEPVMELFLNSTFCLQPRGDSYTRRSIFDAAISGCIPVFFWNQSSYWQYRWFFPDQDESYSVFIDREDVRKGVSVTKTLESIHPRRVENMRNALVEVLPRLVYASQEHEFPSGIKDAFDTAVDGVLLTMLKKNVRLPQKQ